MNDTDLKEVQELAELHFSRKEVATILGLDADLAESEEFEKAFETGRLLCDAQLRRAIFKLAKQGSSPAQNLALKIMEADRVREIREE
jgi:hypothetical protein